MRSRRGSGGDDIRAAEKRGVRGFDERERSVLLQFTAAKARALRGESGGGGDL